MAKKTDMLNTQSLREQIYQYLRAEMQTGNLVPGVTINVNAISQELGISKTPLRDALIQLEAEGFVDILPRRGVVVRSLTLADVKDFYEIIGALEAAVILNVFDLLQSSHIQALKRLNQEQRRAYSQQAYEHYYRLNLDFHGVFLNLSDNRNLQKILMPMKQRLYDFPRQVYVDDWEQRNMDEHDRFIACLEAADPRGAADLMCTVHWSFAYQEKYIHAFYEG
jgi:DNA-binding GntR family transcriptional regulator